MAARFAAWINWLERGITGLEQILLCCLIVAMFCLTLAQVIFRYLLDSPLVWSEELVRYLLVWASMMGAAGALRIGSHFSLTTFVAHLRFGTAAAVSILVNLAVAIFAAAMLVQGVRMTTSGFSEQAVSFPLSMGWFYLAVPVGGGLMLWHVAARTVANWMDRASPRE
ncbi:MAG: TRAP transporter small permease [Xanthobacteraceae bacterium]